MNSLDQVTIHDMENGQMFFYLGFKWRKADGGWAVRVHDGKQKIFSRFELLELEKED